MMSDCQICEVCFSFQTLQSSLEDTIAVFKDYGIEVKAWSDVPKAVRALADKGHVTPIPQGKDSAVYNY